MPMRASLPPGPRYPSAVQLAAFWTRPLASLERARARYGNRFTVRFPFTPPFVMIADPEQVKEIYTAPPDVLKPGRGARVLQPVVGRNSVLLLDGDAHMSQRKLLLPAFHGERMERLEDLVSEVTASEVAAWGAGELELHPRFQALTLEVILRAVFGLDPGARLDSLREALARLLSYGDQPATLLPPPENPDVQARIERAWDRVGPLRGFVSTREAVDRLLFDQIEERRAAGGDEGEPEGDDVLSMLLAARHEDGSPMSDVELRDELVTLLVAGHETTASTLAWAFERLSREPGVAAELAAEVREGDGDEYLTATIHETLRRRPVLPNTAPRYVAKPITVGGWDYEPGVSLVANSYLIHHDPEIYPEPYVFRPERFVDRKPGTYTWIPFGGGRRRCLGMSFAMLEMRIVLREVFRHYDLETATTGHEPPVRRNITITPAGGSRGRLRRAGAREPALA
jgi:cytochrome P450